MVILTNLSNELYLQSRQLLNSSANRFKINNILSYDFEEILGTEFFNNNNYILGQPKGIGYWLWKPYIILKAFETLQENDIVIYSDCGIEVVASLDPLIAICQKQEPVLLFGNGNFVNAKWTKRDCFVLMNCDEERYWYAPHCDAAFALFRKNDFTTNFLKEWLSFGSNANIITDLPNTNGLPNLPFFTDHRWDQSILSLLAEKHKLSLYRMPTQFGNHYKSQVCRVDNEFNCINQAQQDQVNHYHFLPYSNSIYPQLLDHHRTKRDIDKSANDENENSLQQKGDKGSYWHDFKKKLVKVIRREPQ